MGIVELLRRGKDVPTLARAADAERIPVETLAARVLDGTAVLLANAARRDRVRPVAIGSGLGVKVNANIGASSTASGPADEIRKLDAAVRAGADAVMDLSTSDDLEVVCRSILSRSPVPVGTVPVYEAAVLAIREKGAVTRMTAGDLMAAVRRQAEEGVDFQTVHAGFTKAQAEAVARSGRLAGVVSRGGALLACYMAASGDENPYYERFDEVLEICRKHDVTLSLGDSLRPGCLADAGDDAQMEEMRILGDLVLRAREAGVQVIVEGPGHVPLSDVPYHVEEAKRLCHGAPLYLLGPLVVDVAPGYDHITAAIGGAVAAMSGADFLCYVTRAEHVCLPDADDVFEGVMAARIAAHAGEVARGHRGARARDDAMARARKALAWEEQFACALDPETPSRMRAERGSPRERECSMCGPLCAMRVYSEATAHVGEARGRRPA